MSPSDRAKRLTFDAIVSQEIWADYEDSILELFGNCQSEAEIEVVRHILDNACVVTFADLPKKITAMADYARDLLEDGRPLAIVAMAYDGSADGSQTVIQMMKPKLARLKGHRFFNTVPQFLKKGGVDEYPRFMLVDDFAGSGQTVLGRLKDIASNAKSKNVKEEPHVFLLYGMERAHEVISAEGHKVTFGSILRAGLTGYFTGEELAQKISNMKRLEEMLMPVIDGKKMPSFGFNEAEAMFCIHEGNAPNSNFPILWWPTDHLGNDRTAMFTRAEL